MGLHPDLTFYAHSQNPIGKANIEGLLNAYLKHKGDLLANDTLSAPKITSTAPLPDLYKVLTDHQILVLRDCAGNIQDSVVYNTAYETALEKLVERGLLDDISPHRLTGLGYELLKHADAKEEENRLFLLEALEKTIAEFKSKSDE